MKKLFYVSHTGNFETYEDAEKAAKKYTSRDREDYLVFQAIAKAEHPIADVTVTKL